jgi:hypothetical protein
MEYPVHLLKRDNELDGIFTQVYSARGEKVVHDIESCPEEVVRFRL